MTSLLACGALRRHVRAPPMPSHMASTRYMSLLARGARPHPASCCRSRSRAPSPRVGAVQAALAASAPLALHRYASTATSPTAQEASQVAGDATTPALGAPPGMDGLPEETVQHLKRLMASQDQILVDASQWMTDWLPFLPTLTHWVQDLPNMMHLSSTFGSSFAIFIVTILLRTCITMPSVIWARNRILRLSQKLWPEWSKAKQEVPIAVAKDMKRSRTGSQTEFTLRATQALKAKSKELMKKYRCHPIPTFLVPVLVNVPTFVLMSLLIRYGCVPPTPWATEYAPLPWAAPSNELIEKFEAHARFVAEKGVSNEELEQLKPKLGPTLIERDSTGFGSLILGMTYLLATEVSAFRRRLMDQDGEANAAKRGAPSELFNPSKTNSTEQKPSVKEALTPMGRLTSGFRGDIISNIMRCGSILFIVISSQVPSALLIFWLSNAIFTLTQNIALTLADRRTLRKDSQSANAVLSHATGTASAAHPSSGRMARKAPPRSKPPARDSMP